MGGLQEKVRLCKSVGILIVGWRFQHFQANAPLSSRRIGRLATSNGWSASSKSEMLLATWYPGLSCLRRVQTVSLTMWSSRCSIHWRARAHGEGKGQRLWQTCSRRCAGAENLRCCCCMGRMDMQVLANLISDCVAEPVPMLRTGCWVRQAGLWHPGSEEIP